jgi:hypothetical protein
LFAATLTFAAMLTSAAWRRPVGLVVASVQALLQRPGARAGLPCAWVAEADALYAGAGAAGARALATGGSGSGSGSGSGDLDEESGSLGVMGLERRVLDVRGRPTH